MTAPYSGIQIPQPGESLQRKQRVWRVFTDQHGRRFGAVADKGNNTPIAEFTPQGFNPPWLPTMRYAKFAQEGDLDFRWDYDAVAEDWSTVSAAYYEEAIKLSMQLPGAIPAPTVGGEVDYRIRTFLGTPPLSPAIPLACKAGDPWILGRAGALDTLGLKAILTQSTGASGQEALKLIQARLDAMASESGVVPIPTTPEKVIETEVVRTINTVDISATPLEVSYAEFMAEAKQRGKMTHAEAANAWAAHKKNLALESAEAAA